MNFSRSLLTCALFTSSLWTGAAVAQDEEPFEGSVALGYVGTTGNTETTTVNTDILLTYRVNRWTHNGKFQGLAAIEDEVTQAERYYLEGKSDFALDENQFLFGKLSYTDDRFSGYDYQAAASAGYGRYFIRQDTLQLQGFLGAGYRESHIVDAGNEGEVILSIGENLEWEISDNSALVQSFTSDIGDELTVSRFEIGLVTNIIGRVATKIAFQARNTSEVPEGNEKTDTQTSVSLVYSF